MKSILSDIARPAEVDGVQMEMEEVISLLMSTESVRIYMPAQVAKVQPEPVSNPSSPASLTSDNIQVNRTYIIKVRQYMTKPATPEFDFQKKWNNDIPMPFRIMKGRALKETRGMVYMDCHAVPLETSVCMRCGRTLTHPVSRLYGIGPECGGHAHINPFETKEELYAELESVRAKLLDIKWRGWIIKSAIEEVSECK